MIGIDGTADGWIGARFQDQYWTFETSETLGDFSYDGEALIDIPIGLPEHEERACDRSARQFLAPQRHHSIFKAPVRPAVYAQSYERAADIQEQRTGKRISKQSYYICPSIREADQYEGPLTLIESHPEVLFKCNDADAVSDSKHTPEGRNARLDVLKGYGTVDRDRWPAAPDIDDIIDAMILAVASAQEQIVPLRGPGADEPAIHIPATWINYSDEMNDR